MTGGITYSTKGNFGEWKSCFWDFGEWKFCFWTRKNLETNLQGFSYSSILKKGDVTASR